VYSFSDYEADVSEHAPWLRHIGGCIVEALPAKDDTLAELGWIQEQLKQHAAHGSSRVYCTVARINLMQDLSLPDLLNRMLSMSGLSSGAGCSGVVGVRQILNFEPSWPFVQSNLLKDNAFLENFDVLRSHHVKVFELHVNPHQLREAAQCLVRRYSSVTFVLNHMGCLRGNNVDSFDTWYQDVAALSRCPNVFVKLSGFEYSDPENWSTSALVRNTIHSLVSLFGTARCMIATNFPVTSTLGAPPQQLFPFLREQLQRYGSEDLNNLFWRTALRVYLGLDELPAGV
jgi:predicted TIM-barrel fold metal-dependent hydrolase